MKKINLLIFLSFLVSCLILTSCTKQHNTVEGWMHDSESHWHECLDCDDRHNNEAHLFSDWIITTPATIHEEGSRHRICSICAYDQIEIISILSHTHSYSDWNIITPATYFDAGLKKKTCSECGDVVEEEIPIIYHTHVYSQWEIITPGTETENGSKQRTCTVCADIETEVIYSSSIIEENIDNSLKSYVDRLIDETNSYIPAWNKESFKGRWNYIDGVFLNSVVSLYYTYEKDNSTLANKYKDFLVRYVNYYVNPQGQFVNPVDQTLSFRYGELDSICESKILFDLYNITEDPRYIAAIQFTYEQLMNQYRVAGTVNFSHKDIYQNQIWLDGMYMYAPFYARYAIFADDATIFDTIKHQYQNIREHMFDEEKKLYYHGYDATKSIFWADPITGCSSSFWLRSMGWYMVSLCDTLEFFPEGENKEYLKGLLAEAVEGIMQYQDTSTKMFYQVIDKADESIYVNGDYLSALKNTQYPQTGAVIQNYLESSGSSMIAYTLLKGSRLGYLDTSYEQKGEEVFKGIYTHSFKNNELHDICITAGLGPSTSMWRDGSMAYYLAEPVGSSDAKGVGPFIMAFLEYRFELETLDTPKLADSMHTITIHIADNLYYIHVNKNTAYGSLDHFQAEGYSILNWYLDAEYTVLYDPQQLISSDTDIYAKVEKISLYVHFVTFGGTYMDSILVRYAEEANPISPTKYGWIFEGWYKDPDFTEPYYNSAIYNTLTLYAKYRKDYMTDQFLENTDYLISEDFSNMSQIDKFTNWGTKGFYMDYGQKKDSNGNTIENLNHTENYIDFENEKLNLRDLSNNNSTRAIIDFGGNISTGAIEGYLELTLENTGRGWTFLQFYGHDYATTSISEKLGLRTFEQIIDSNIFYAGYRINADSTVYYPSLYQIENKEYRIYFRYDFSNQRFDMEINGNQFITDLQVNIHALSGIRLTTSDLNTRRSSLDNVYIRHAVM